MPLPRFSWSSESILGIRTGFVISLLATLVESIVHLKFDYLTHRELVIIPFSIFFLTLYVEDILHSWPIRAYKGALKEVSSVPKDLSEYIRDTILKRIKSMRRLANGEGAECTYSEQLAIANKLVMKADRKLWATTTDKPSRLWQQGYHYFVTQENLPLDGSTNTALSSNRDEQHPKIRIVVCDWADIRSDLSDPATRIAFEAFVKWHDENSFLLRFYLSTTDKAIKAIARTVMDDKDIMADYMVVRDGDFVYGRTNEISEDRVTVRWIPATTEGFDTCGSYERAFVDLLHISVDYNYIKDRWNIEHNRTLLRRQLLIDYGQKFNYAIAGEEFFREVCKQISHAEQPVRAVDIADCKGAGDAWAWKDEYQDFFKATMDAKRSGREVSRIFVLQDLSLLLNNDFSYNIKRHLDARIEVAILTINEAKAADLKPDDFILVEGTFGFRLDEEAEFDRHDLEFVKNLIPKNNLSRYVNLVESLKQKARSISTVQDLTDLINDVRKQREGSKPAEAATTGGGAPA